MAFSIDASPHHTSEYWLTPNSVELREVKKVAASFVRGFGVEPQDLYWSGDSLEQQLLVFDQTVASFYNRDLAYSVANYLVLGLKQKYPVSQRWYLAEDAISRVSRCWEYLMQAVTALVGLDRIATRSIRDAILQRSNYDVHLLPVGSRGQQVLYTPRDSAESLTTIQTGRRELRYQRVDRAAKSLRREIFDEFVGVAGLVRTFELARTPALLDLDTLRNNIEHWTPAGSYLRRTESTAQGTTVRGGKDGLVNPLRLQKLLRDAAGDTAEAIGLVRGQSSTPIFRIQRG